MRSLARSPNRRLQIGVLLTELDGEYHRGLVDGVCRRATAAGVDLVFYPGHLPGAAEPFEQQFGAVFEMVDPALLDGLLVLASSLQYYLDSSGMRDSCRASRRATACASATSCPAGRPCCSTTTAASRRWCSTSSRCTATATSR